LICPGQAGPPDLATSMSASSPPSPPIGVRPAGRPGAQVRWIDPAGFTHQIGDRVVVGDRGVEWLAEIVVGPFKVVEAPDLGVLPRVARRADPADWPPEPTHAGATLLQSLGLPPEAASRTGG